MSQLMGQPRAPA